MGVGRRLGLYSDIDKISLMSWCALTPTRSFFTRTRRMNEWPLNRQQQAVTKLWSAMCVSFPDVLLPVRDCSLFKHRYLDHPEYTYELTIVSSRLTGQPKSLTVLRTHADHLEFLDYLGPAHGVASALGAARMQAANAGLPLLQGWFTQRLTQIFNIGEPIVQDAGIEVPTNIWGKAQVAGVLASPIWLMAGDSDFR